MLAMGKNDKLIQKVLSGRQDTSLSFAELTHLLFALGFSERIRGSHHIYTRSEAAEIINIQPNGFQAKPYQVKQIRDIIIKYQLGVSDE
ncbi:toxin HicA [Planctomycetales bacterium]|nr:toxin HicA [Planctomycetales bacterium]